MKWKSKKYLRDRCGETKLVRKFLLMPRQSNDNKHWHWFEWAIIREEIKEIDSWDAPTYYQWRETELNPPLTSVEIAQLRIKNES